MFRFFALCAVLVLAVVPTASAAPAAQTTKGTFLGVEQGDYAHWKMRIKGGKEVSYFILRPDASVQEVLDDPKARLGQRCAVKWITTVENIPEAGGKMTVEQILGVEWLGKAK